MSENGIQEAEQRVREMNIMTQQYSEQGNRYLQNMRNMPNSRQTRFEPAEPYPRVKNGQDDFRGNRMVNQQQVRNDQRSFQNNPGNFQNDHRNFQNNHRNGQGSFQNRQGNSPNRQSPHAVSGNNRAFSDSHAGGNHSHHDIHNSAQVQHSMGFPDLIADNEKLMILLLIYLLMKEKADIKLILALGYILLN